MRWPLGGKFELPTWFITVLYSYCHHDYRLDYECYFLGGKFQNSKLFCHFYTENVYLRLSTYVPLL
jgi:hypothetical protein